MCCGSAYTMMPNAPFLPCCLQMKSWYCGSVFCDYWRQQTFPCGHWSPCQPAAWPSCMACHQSPDKKQKTTTTWMTIYSLHFDSSNTAARDNCLRFNWRLTPSLELEVEDVEEGDSGEEEGEERREGDGEEELDEVLLWGADGRTTTTSSSSSRTLLLHSSSCWDSNRDTSFPTKRKRGGDKCRLLCPKLTEHFNFQRFISNGQSQIYFVNYKKPEHTVERQIVLGGAPPVLANPFSVLVHFLCYSDYSTKYAVMGHRRWDNSYTVFIQQSESKCQWPHFLGMISHHGQNIWNGLIWMHEGVSPCDWTQQQWTDWLWGILGLIYC